MARSEGRPIEHDPEHEEAAEGDRGLREDQMGSGTEGEECSSEVGSLGPASADKNKLRKAQREGGQP